MNRLVLLFTTKKLTNPQISNIRGNSPTHLGQETRVADTKCLQSTKPLVLVLSGVEYLNSVFTRMLVPVTHLKWNQHVPLFIRYFLLGNFEFSSADSSKNSKIIYYYIVVVVFRILVP